VKAGN